MRLARVKLKVVASQQAITPLETPARRFLLRGIIDRAFCAQHSSPAGARFYRAVERDKINMEKALCAA